jgi:cardiolipin synthase
LPLLTSIFDRSVNAIVDLFAIVGVLAAVATTVHVLLNKRDVRAAIGWIGLAWLSPLSGPALYYLFGINRVSRRAARLALADGFRRAFAFAGAPPEAAALAENIATIEAVSARLTRLPLTPGNAVTVLRGGDEAYPAMLAAIGAARHSVALTSYIFRADAVGGAFVAALRAAQARGVEVRVLADGFGSGYLVSPAVDELAQAGVPAARFLHDWRPWRMPFLNMRSHKKLLLIDGTEGFVGGLNIGIENWRKMTLKRKRPVEDVHFRVAGPVVALLMRSFAEDWAFTTGEDLLGPAWWPPIEPAGGVLARGVDSGPDEDLGILEAILTTAVNAAKRRLRIVTPYFLPDRQLMSAIVLAARRGVAVEIVLPERSDHPLMGWAMRAHLDFYAVPGMTIHVTGPAFDHAKLATVDGAWAAFGSPNWDVRSLRLNFEFMMECYDAATAAAIDRLIDEKIARARRLDLAELKARPLPVRLGAAAARLLLPYL